MNDFLSDDDPSLGPLAKRSLVGGRYKNCLTHYDNDADSFPMSFAYEGVPLTTEGLYVTAEGLYVTY